MRKTNLVDFTAGWFVGDFEPSLLRSPDFEVGVKFFEKGQRELEHYQLISTEYTIVVLGECRIGGYFLKRGDILEIPPLESADFEALTDVSLVVVKSPSIPSDKVVGKHEPD